MLTSISCQQLYQIAKIGVYPFKIHPFKKNETLLLTGMDYFYKGFRKQVNVV